MTGSSGFRCGRESFRQTGARLVRIGFEETRCSGNDDQIRVFDIEGCSGGHSEFTTSTQDGPRPLRADEFDTQRPTAGETPGVEHLVRTHDIHGIESVEQHDLRVHCNLRFCATRSCALRCSYDSRRKLTPAVTAESQPSTAFSQPHIFCEIPVERIFHDTRSQNLAPHTLRFRHA